MATKSKRRIQYNGKRDFVYKKVPAGDTGRFYPVTVTNVGQGHEKAVEEAKKLAMQKYQAEIEAERKADEPEPEVVAPEPIIEPVVEAPAPVVEPVAASSGNEALALAAARQMCNLLC